MQRIVVVILLCVLVFSLTACNGTSAATGSNNQDNISSLKTENESLKSQVKDLEVKVQTLESENEELKNGAQRLLNEAQEAFKNKNYDLVVSDAKLLSEKHAGSEEAKEAQKLADQVSEIKADEAKQAEAEAEKLKKEQEKSAQDKAREIIRVKKVYTGEPNSAGGVNLYIVWQNTSQETIKYAYFSVDAYNEVGDIVYSELSLNNSSFRGKETGPIKPKQVRDDSRYWECAWYNNTIVKAVINQIDIEYMDGTSVTIKDDDLKYVQY